MSADAPQVPRGEYWTPTMAKSRLPSVLPPVESAPGRFRCGPALDFTVDATCGRARATTLHLPHGPMDTPMFMPVGTQGTIKGLTVDDLRRAEVDCRMILGNTYHLGNRPGGDTMEAVGGLHSFMSWDRNILTDSGGFQMVSLLHLAEIDESGVWFQSPMDGTRMLLTPEMSMHLQNQIGSDIMMALDDVVDSRTVDDARFHEACYRTLRWIDRCIAAHGNKERQNLFGIVQGGLDTRPGGLREVCLRGMLERDADLPGYAIGGIAGGEDKSHFWRVVAMCSASLPSHKPRYVMGVGYPLDLVLCTALGVDMYDCVFPTRTARFGTALVPGGQFKLKQKAFVDDPRPIDETCPCFVCQRYSRGHLNSLFKHAESLGPQLVSLHNVAYMLRVSRAMRRAIFAGEYREFAHAFVAEYFPEPGSVPQWVQDALRVAEIPLEGATDDGALRGEEVPLAGDAGTIPLVNPSRRFEDCSLIRWAGKESDRAPVP